MINIVCGIRSTGRICTDLALKLEKQGHEVKIAYGREQVPEQYKRFAVRIGNYLDVSLHGSRARVFDSAGFGSKWYTEQFIKWMKKYDPDVIHLHNLHGYYINVEVLFHYLRSLGGRKKIIWTIHDCWAFTGHCVYFDSANCMKWQGGCYDCPKKRSYPKSWLLDKSKCNYMKKEKLFTGIENLLLVTPSEWMGGLVKQSYLKEYPVKVIHNGVDTTIFKQTLSDLRQKYKLENKKVILGVSAFWEKRKGLEDMIELARRLNDHYQIILIGISQKQKKGIPNSIITVPRTDSQQELAQYYTMADVYVNPTYEDNYPTTNLEAIACGTPVVTYNTGGSGESARMYGSVVDKGDIGKMKMLIEKGMYMEKEIDIRKFVGKNLFINQTALLYSI